MNVIILAGGKGSRLGTVTQTIPKPMARVGGLPIIWHIMNTYAKYGHKDFVVALGYLGDVIKDYFHNYNQMSSDLTIDLGSGEISYHQNMTPPVDWRISLINTGENTLKGGRICRLKNYIKDTTMLTYGDGVADINIDELLDFHRSHGRCLTLTGVCPPSRFGELNLDGNQVTGFEEKPQTSQGLINGGYMVFEPSLLNYLTEDEDCDFEYGALEKLARLGEVMVYQHRGSWACVDHERDLDYLNKLWDQKKAFWA